MKFTTKAGTAASLLASVGLLASFVPSAHAATASGTTSTTAASTTSVATLKKSSGNLTFIGAAGQHIAAVRAAATGTTGAVTLADNAGLTATPSSEQPVDETLSQNGTTISEPFEIYPNTYSAPQILPAGTYTLTVNTTNPDGTPTTTVVASSSFTVAAGADSSEVLYPTSSSTDNLTQYSDPVSSVPAGEATLSVRHTSYTAGPVDVYVDGQKVITALVEGGSSGLTVPAGSYQVSVYRTGQTTGALFSATLEVTPDAYVPLYAVDDPSQATGVNLSSTPYIEGYQFTASDGGVFNFGGYPFLGSTGSVKLNKPVVGGAEASDDSGYYLAASDGGVFAFGGAPFEGSLGATKLNAPIVGIAATFGDNGDPGYLLVAADGGVFTFNAHFYGSLGGTKLTSPVIGISADPSTGGYVIAQADGSITAFGPGITPATTPALALNKPIVGVTETPDGGGAWLVASDGGVFTVGDAGFYGSTGAMHLNEPVVGISSSYDGLGYALIASDGGVFNFGDSTFYGSTGSLKLNEPIVGAIN
jgi:hypothetical protein